MMKHANSSRLNMIILGAVITAVLLFLLTQSQAIIHNLTLRYIDYKWNTVTLTGLTVNNNLQDGLPDNWQARTWNGGQGIIHKTADIKRTGNAAISVEKTNNTGVAALSQIVTIPENSNQLSFWVFARGDAGAAQVRFIIQNQPGTQNGGWQTIPATEEWQRYQVETAIPANAVRAEVLLRSNGQTFFDDTFLLFVLPAGERENYLANPGFEIDGIEQDPLLWWQEHAILPDIETLPDIPLSDELPYLSILDMIDGRYQAISQRINEQTQSCGSRPELTSWLLNLAPELEQQGGPAAREKLYQLGIALAPTCPQPHGYLARLYEDNRAFWAAAEQYRLAAELAGDTPLAGYYYYNEGLTHVRQTGHLERAIIALSKAEQLESWVVGVVFQGSATYNLGLALRDAERFDEAAAAFQRVLDCDACINYQKPAAAALNTLP